MLKKVKNSKTRREKPNQEKERKRRGVSVPHVAGLSEKIQRIFSKHEIPVYFKPTNTLRQKLVHPKDKIPNTKQSNLIYSIRCQESGCREHYIGETKQLLKNRLYQHKRGNDDNKSAVYEHLKTTNHSFNDEQVKILGKEKRWFERGVKEAIFVKKYGPSLNRGGGLRYVLPQVYNNIVKTDIHKQKKSSGN